MREKIHHNFHLSGPILSIKVEADPQSAPLTPYLQICVEFGS